MKHNNHMCEFVSFCCGHGTRPIDASGAIDPAAPSSKEGCWDVWKEATAEEKLLMGNKVE